MISTRNGTRLPFALCAAIFLALTAMVAISCGKVESTASGEQVIDERLLAYLSAARSLHHEADIAEDRDDVKTAIATLERLIVKPAPVAAPEIDEVIADTRARLGDLRSRPGEGGLPLGGARAFDVAHDDIADGLRHATGTTYFRGHLLEVQGLVEERRAKVLDAGGDKDGAKKAREAAMKAYEDSIAVQDEVIKRGASDGGKP